jgi:hypothetical protein
MDNIKAQESWNMATETLKRLSRCLDMCTYYSQVGDLPNWFNATLSLQSNVSCFLEPSESLAIEDKLKEMPKKWRSPNGVIRNTYGSVYVVLNEVYKLCLLYMKSKGLLMPKTSDPRAAVLNN